MNRYERHVAERICRPDPITHEDAKWLKPFIRDRRDKRRSEEHYAPYDPLAKRASFVAHIRAMECDGLVGILDQGMDCDCTRWERRYNMPAVPRQIEAMMDRAYEDAEGPQAFCITQPVADESYESRDLALEAFEDGHDHVVYA